MAIHNPYLAQTMRWVPLLKLFLLRPHRNQAISDVVEMDRVGRSRRVQDEYRETTGEPTITVASTLEKV